LKSNGRIYVSFTDSREARHAMDKVHVLRPEWRVVPLTASEYARRSGSFVDQISDFEGQIYVTVYYDCRNPNLDDHTVGSSIKNLAETFGDVKAFRALCTGQRNLIEFQIEFFDTRDAENAVTVLNGTSLEVRYDEHHITAPLLNSIFGRTAFLRSGSTGQMWSHPETLLLVARHVVACSHPDRLGELPIPIAYIWN
jgi:hypothetical protein